MTTDASRTDGHGRPGTRTISIAAVLVLVIGALGAYQLGRPKHASLPRGGAFAAAKRTTASPSPDVVQSAGPTAGAPTQVPDFLVVPATSRPTTTTVGLSSTTAVPPSGGLAPVVSGPLSLGVYTYALSGSESSTGFGSRQYPSQLAVTAHGGPGLGKDQAVLDLSFSKDHQERDIVAYRDDAIAFTFESGSITFGPATQNSEADYSPPMVQIPLPLHAGDQRGGTTQARSKNGSVSRVEDWAVKVLCQETVRISGQDVPTWVVSIDRKTRGGSTDQAVRSRTYWFDPARRIWVKWHEKTHSQHTTVGVTLIYDTTYDAVLSGFKAP